MIYAIECDEIPLPNDITHPKVIPLDSFENHARIHNEALEADDIIVYGSTIETFAAASSLRTYLDKSGKEDTKITIIDDQIAEARTIFGESIY